MKPASVTPCLSKMETINSPSTPYEAILDYYALDVANFLMCTYVVTALPNAADNSLT